MARRRLPIGQILKEEGLLSEEQIKEILLVQQKTGEKFGQIVINQGYADAVAMAKVLAKQQGFPFIDLSSVTISSDILAVVPVDLCKRYLLIPIAAEGARLKVAISDPMNLMALDDLRVFLGRDIDPVVAPRDEILKAIEIYHNGQGAISGMSSLKESGFAEQKVSPESSKNVMDALIAEGEKVGEDEAPVIKLVSSIILEAFKRRASDIHVEPLKDRVRVRYRIDGMLQEVPGPSKPLQGSILSRLKIMAKIDIAEKRLPQDGRIKLTLSGRDVDVRVSTLPALYGESVVLRLLDRQKLLLNLDHLGFSEHDEETFENLINLPNGIILVTGPTGSGKTTTLYTSLHSINKPNRKIITVEDPVEYQLKGINQVQVKPNIGLTFASGLRAILRQAPNVIMIGEIRDLETASIAIESSLTGHLVFSTLHTNDAAGAITRLIDMGVKSYLVASSVRAILAQRLVKKICLKCKERTMPNQEVIDFLHLTEEQLAETFFYKGRGCFECSYTGYLGRVAIFELLVLNDDICDLIYKHESSNTIKDRARQCGMRTLREDALEKAFKGVTSLEEVIRVTQGDID